MEQIFKEVLEDALNRIQETGRFFEKERRKSFMDEKRLKELNTQLEKNSSVKDKIWDLLRSEFLAEDLKNLQYCSDGQYKRNLIQRIKNTYEFIIHKEFVSIETMELLRSFKEFEDLGV